jgi:hypothetical protein
VKPRLLALALCVAAFVGVPDALPTAVVLESPSAELWHAEQVVRGQGYGLAWGQERAQDAYLGGLRDRVMGQTAVWWDESGGRHVVSPTPVEREGFTFRLVYARSYDPATGDLFCLGACLEWLDWFDENALIAESEPWNGPRWSTVRVQAAAPAFPADFNRDGTVDTRDVAAFLNVWTPQSRGK